MTSNDKVKETTKAAPTPFEARQVDVDLSAPSALKPKAARHQAGANRFPDVYPDNNAYVIAQTAQGPVFAQYRNDENDTMTSKHGGFYSRVGAGGYSNLEGKVTAWAPMPDLTVAPAEPNAGMSSIGG